MKLARRPPVRSNVLCLHLFDIVVCCVAAKKSKTAPAGETALVPDIEDPVPTRGFLAAPMEDTFGTVNSPAIASEGLLFHLLKGSSNFPFSQAGTRCLRTTTPTQIHWS